MKPISISQEYVDGNREWLADIRALLNHSLVTSLGDDSLYKVFGTRRMLITLEKVKKARDENRIRFNGQVVVIVDALV